MCYTSAGVVYPTSAEVIKLGIHHLPAAAEASEYTKRKAVGFGFFLNELR